MTKTHHGSSLDAFLQAEGTFDQAQALALIETKLLTGLAGSESAMTAADWDALRAEARAQVERKKTAR